MKPTHTIVNCWFCNQDTVVPYGNRNCWDCPHCEQYNGFQEVWAPLLPAGGRGPKALGWQCHTTTSGGSGFTPRSFWLRSPFPALCQTRSRQALCRGRVAALWAMLCCDRPALSSHRRRQHGHKRAWALVRRNLRRPRQPASRFCPKEEDLLPGDTQGARAKGVPHCPLPPALPRPRAKV